MLASIDVASMLNPAQMRKNTIDADLDAPPPRRAASPVKDKHLCYVCCLARRNAVIMECGHGGLCFECGKSLAQRHPRTCQRPVAVKIFREILGGKTVKTPSCLVGTCPICRGPISSVLKVERRERGSSLVISNEGVVVTTRASDEPPSPAADDAVPPTTTTL